MSEDIKNQEVSEIEDTENPGISEAEDEEMAKAAGGGIFHATGAAYDPDRRWEVVDETGDCPARFQSEKEAKQYCELNGITKNRIWFYETRRKMRKAYKDHLKNTPELKNWQNPFGHSWYS